ncbi:MAG: hypothetical protein GF398_02730 [Chitinivibrionales bacterium]|nr:hypothetical protein [Chitinivibrionales bacterium]
MSTHIFAYADKTMLRITGLSINGLKPHQLEKKLIEKLHTTVRVIGVSGDSIEMDIYDAAPEAVARNSAGIITTLATTPGVTAADIESMHTSDRIVSVNASDLPGEAHEGCARERWIEIACAK